MKIKGLNPETIYGVHVHAGPCADLGPHYFFDTAVPDGDGPAGDEIWPGPVITNEDGLRRVEVQGARARMLVTMPDDIAPIAIRGMLTGKGVILPGMLVKVLVLVACLVPRRVRMRVLEKIFSRYREDQPVEQLVR